MSLRPIITLGEARLRRRGETMRDAPGVGIPPPQVGLDLRVCVIEIGGQLHELINPRLVLRSGEENDLEGCLSVPGFYAYRTRAARAVIDAQDRNGRKVRLAGPGLLGRALQHE